LKLGKSEVELTLSKEAKTGGKQYTLSAVNDKSIKNIKRRSSQTKASIYVSSDEHLAYGGYVPTQVPKSELEVKLIQQVVDVCNYSLRHTHQGARWKSSHPLAVGAARRPDVSRSL